MKELDKVLTMGGKSEYDRVLTNLIWGFNHRNVGLIGLDNDDTQGYNFYTRPELNLSYDNLKNVPELDFLWKGGPYSMGAVIRAYLDPINSRPGGEAYTPLVDHRNPFIPMLTNLNLDFSGVQDIVNNLWTSPTGRFEEQYFIPVGISGVRNIWDSNHTFQNVRGDPITSLFFAWVTYINRVAENSMAPHERNLIEDELDSTTRHYRYITDVTGLKYTKSFCSIASIPTASTIGSAFDKSSSSVYSEANKTISVPFTNLGGWYMDPNIHDAFNKVVQIFNPDMRPDKDGIINRMHRLSPAELKLFNWDAYPRIDEINQRLDWYVSIDKYETLMIGEETDDATRLRGIVNTSLRKDMDERIAKLGPGLATDLLENS